MKENRLTLVFLGKHKKAPSYRGCFNKNNKYLNPLTPCGVRRHRYTEPRNCHFNPLTPYGVRLIPICPDFSAIAFQSTRPVRGETYNLLPVRQSRGLFQSTHHVCGETTFILAWHIISTISIHSPPYGARPVHHMDYH